MKMNKHHLTKACSWILTGSLLFATCMGVNGITTKAENITGNQSINTEQNSNSTLNSNGSLHQIGPQNEGPSTGSHSFVNPEEITISITKGKDVLDEFSPIWIDTSEISDGKATVETASSHDLKFQIAFGKSASKIIVNDVEYTPEDLGEGQLKVTVPDSTTYSVSIIEAESMDVTIMWSYDKKDEETDYYVENGKVEVISIKRGETTIFDEKTPSEDVRIDDKGGWVAIQKGDDVVLKLIPDYGYQLKSATINDQVLQPQEGVSVFSLPNIQGNLHFMSAFEKQEDIITDNSSAISNVSITNGANAATTGNLSLSVSDNSSYSTDATSVLNYSATTVASVDINLNNVVSKGTGEAGAAGAWTTNITEFEKPITVEVKVDSANLTGGETYSIVRDHNGTLTELNATYNESTGMLSFDTNQFSTYTIVKKSEEKKELPSKLSVSSISDSDITSDMKNAGFDTTVKVKDQLSKQTLSNAKPADITEEQFNEYVAKNSAFFDVKMQVSLDNGVTWVAATKENFPKDGVKVSIPYPEGTDKTYNFIVAHMASTTVGTMNAGDVEFPAVTKTENGLEFVANGLSPMMVTWIPKINNNNNNQNNSQNTNNNNSNNKPDANNNNLNSNSNNTEVSNNTVENNNTNISNNDTNSSQNNGANTNNAPNTGTMDYSFLWIVLLIFGLCTFTFTLKAYKRNEEN